MITAKGNMTILIISAVLLLFAGVLIANNYNSQIELRQASIDQLHQSLEKQAMTIGYFFQERGNDLKNLSKNRSVSAYFENLALGMTMEYGLKSSLNNITREFDLFQQEKQVGGKTLYSRIVLIDKTGTLISASGSSREDDRLRDWKSLQSPQADEPHLVEAVNNNIWEIIISLPYFFKGEYAGQILAWLYPDVPSEYFLISGGKADHQITGLLCGAGHLHLGPGSPAWASVIKGEDLKGMENNSFSKYPPSGDAGQTKPLFVMKTSVPSTPFSLVSFMDHSSVMGRESPSHLLFAMGLFTAVVLAVTIILFKANTRNLILRTRIAEADKGRREIEEKNLQLQREISERQQAEEKNKKLADQLVQAQKMKAIGLMAGGVAHDLNNILSGLINYPELLLLQLPKDSELREIASEIKDTGKRAAAVVADLLTVARGIASVKEITNLNVLVTDYLNSPEHKQLRAHYPGVVCRTELAADLGNISCSRVHIKKCLMNMVTNGAEAVHKSGEILISTRNKLVQGEEQNLAKGEYVVLAVRDSGPGISENDISRIFEPFYTKKVMGRSGTGLGLSVVWNTVQEHGGAIQVESSETGTVLELYFPVTREAYVGEEEFTLGQETLKGHGELVLVVDDERLQRDIASRLLTILGYRVETAASGEDAVAFMKKHDADLLLLDMIMEPGINGRETYEQILTLHPDQKAVIVSGFSQNSEVEKMQDIGTCLFIRKPYTLAQLGKAAREILAAA